VGGANPKDGPGGEDGGEGEGEGTSIEEENAGRGGSAGAGSVRAMPGREDEEEAEIESEGSGGDGNGGDGAEESANLSAREQGRGVGEESMGDAAVAARRPAAIKGSAADAPMSTASRGAASGGDEATSEPDELHDRRTGEELAALREALAELTREMKRKQDALEKVGTGPPPPSTPSPLFPRGMSPTTRG